MCLTTSILVTDAGANTGLIIDNLLNFAFLVVFVVDDRDWAYSSREPGYVGWIIVLVARQNILPCS